MVHKVHTAHSIQYAFTNLFHDDATASSGDGSRKKNIVVVVFVSLSVLVLFGFVGFFIWNKFFRNRGVSPKSPISVRRNIGSCFCKSTC